MKAEADPEGIRRLAERVLGLVPSDAAPQGDLPDALGFGHPLLAATAGRFHDGSVDTAGGLGTTTTATGERLGLTADLYDDADDSGSEAADGTAGRIEDGK